MNDFNILLVASIALLTGGVIGVLMARQFSADGQKQKELERNLEKLTREQKEYQHQVVEHFTDTAKLLNTLAESYRDVHNHLATGAVSLCNDQAASILPRIPDGTLTDFTQGPDLENLQPPLDYAPKTSPYETGMLNEEFGLEKKARAEEAVADNPASDAPTSDDPAAERKS